MKRLAILAMAVAAVTASFAEVDFNVGADLRVRQEFYDNVPGLPGGGLLSTAPYGKYVNRMRFRPRVWGELKFADKLRIYSRLTDEFRWNVTNSEKNRKSEFPEEVFLDNLFIEGVGFFDGFFDFVIGRQDVYKLYGLDHIFQDCTPGDGSRSIYSDMVRFTLNFEEDRKLDVFGLYHHDDNHLRWGTSRSAHRQMTGLGAGAEPEMDEWAIGAVWSAQLSEALPYQLFAIHKNSAAYMRGDSKRPSRRVETIGAKVTPQLTDEWSLQFEAMGQVGENGLGKTLYGWSSYAGVNWKSASESVIKPFGSAALHFMSGSKDTAETDGGHGAWDPMWSRAAWYSEIFLYGTHYGTCWWSNMLYARFEAGLDFGRRHSLNVTTGPIFAQAQDGLGGGDGHFKGVLTTARYTFPLRLPDKEKGERIEVFGHLHGEVFNPGDYYESDRAGWFLRWQVEFKF